MVRAGVGCRLQDQASWQWALWSKATLLVLLAALGTPVQAQKVYKCEQAGQVTYSQVPCPDGKTERVEIAPGPSSSERYDAQRRAQTEKYRAASIRAGSGSGYDARPSERSAYKPQCGQLEARRMQVLQQRNAALSQARRGAGVGPDVPVHMNVGYLNSALADIEAAMLQYGCTPGN